MAFAPSSKHLKTKAESHTPARRAGTHAAPRQVLLVSNTSAPDDATARSLQRPRGKGQARHRSGTRPEDATRGSGHRGAVVLQPTWRHDGASGKHQEVKAMTSSAVKGHRPNISTPRRTSSRLPVPGAGDTRRLGANRQTQQNLVLTRRQQVHQTPIRP